MDPQEGMLKINLSHKLRHTMENQKLVLDVLGEAYQHLWHDEELRTKCDEAMREVSREAVRTARQWLDLADSYDRSKEREQRRDQEGIEADLPF